LKKFWTGYLGIITLLVLFFYGADFGQFAYINARLNADALIFAEDPQESLEMVWQSYPVDTDRFDRSCIDDGMDVPPHPCWCRR
jgi:hypothetical protein